MMKFKTGDINDKHTFAYNGVLIQMKSINLFSIFFFSFQIKIPI